ncbi:rab-GTPase-TBC domain-containing protein [Cladorrhinum samala]|uniref:GTPase-activating protein GYP5 n=1 Tax=Cladorrhinum samala TaxID=585594 RepID=A0AAV9HJ99_9PEZI|nr:rab-GTPase-TBC domain-containing protein [Cladorrhinum samala]
MSAPNEETVTTVDETLDAVKPEETKAADTVIDTKEKEAAEDQRPVSRDDSDKDEDAFEDAVETGSLRSLTKRQPPVKRLSVGDQVESDYENETPQLSPVAVNGAPMEESLGAAAEAVDEQTPVDQKQLRRLSTASAGSLDNVNLDDDSTPTAATQLEKSAGKEHTAKTMSFSSITNVLPPLPWSPQPSDPQSKSPPAASVAPATVPATSSLPIPAPPAPPPAPATTGRKFNSPFSWLSRSSSKDPAPVPPAPSPRRNTASSVATITSNPEMMLSKLDEEKDGAPRNSLKDRFKALRLRDEVGIIAEDDKISETGDGMLAVQPLPSPMPQSPNRNLAPGTVAGVMAGPSSIADTAVDWDLWQAVVNEGPAAVARSSAEELNKAIATGIPSAIRGVIWQVLAQSKNEDLEVVYRELVARGTDKEKESHANGTSASNGGAKESASSASSVSSEKSASSGSPSPTDKDSESALKTQAAAAAERKKKDKEDLAMLQKLEKVIRRDLGARTSYSKFAAAQGLQEGLFGVCKAYALFDEGVGYAQGMNFLIMPLLFNMPEEEAFCLLVRLMNQYQLRDLFIQDMPGLHLRLYQFERLLEDLEPALYCHLRRRHISPHLYATQWFLTLFAYRFPLQLVLRIYDLIFSEGLSAILKFGIVLMQKNVASLLALNDMAQLTSFLKDRLFDVYIDATPSSNSILENGFFGSSSASMDKEVYRADQLVRDACEVKITPEMLKSYQVEWEEKTRTEKEREAELESLRGSNASYAARVRKLEERIEAVDREQAELATDLVRTKVENEELKDENESLKGQVKELRIVIDKQPLEIEAVWQLERDDLMKRNQKVHEENESLEKELKDLEEELVQTKLKYAEVNSQHESLKQKWNDLRKHIEN